MDEIDIKGKVIQFVKPNGNIIAMITVSEQGFITGGINCECEDHSPNILIKQIENIL